MEIQKVEASEVSSVAADPASVSCTVLSQYHSLSDFLYSKVSWYELDGYLHAETTYSLLWDSSQKMSPWGLSSHPPSLICVETKGHYVSSPDGSWALCMVLLETLEHLLVSAHTSNFTESEICWNERICAGSLVVWLLTVRLLTMSS